MCNRIKTFLALFLLFVTVTTNAQLQRHSYPVLQSNGLKTAEQDVNETWWGYFDGDYNSLSVVGLGSGIETPINYSCAIKVEAGNPEVLGRRIKALQFAFQRLDYIADVSVWVSSTLPSTPAEADIRYVPVDVADLVSLETDNAMNVVDFEPYQVRNNDVYVGYSFTVTSREGDLCTYPIVVAYSNTMANAFFLDWGDGWMDNAGQDYGNLAVLLLLDDGGDFEMGDVNFDLNINVLDVSSTIEYILNGKVAQFNKKSADIDGNGEINIVDAESIVDIILERYEAPADKQGASSNDAVLADVTDEGFGVSLHAENAYRGFQMDIVLPEGCDITSLTADNMVAATHNVRYSKIEDGRYRVVASSINGSALAGNVENLFNIKAETNDIKVENIVFATDGLQEKRFADIRQSDVTGIENVTSVEKSAEIYDICGVKVNGALENLAKGVYIVNGKKVIIK